MFDFNDDDSLTPTEDVLGNVTGPFFLLEITDLTEDDKIATALTFNGFEEPWQRAVLKDLLTQIADEL